MFWSWMHQEWKDGVIDEGVMEECGWTQDQEMVIEHSCWPALRWLSGLIKVYEFG